SPEPDPKPKSEPVPFANQLPIGVSATRGRGRGVGRGKSVTTVINPHFRGRRGIPEKHIEGEPSKIKYPDIKVAKPWLRPLQPDPAAVEMSRKRKDEQLSDPNSLLWTYWKA